MILTKSVLSIYNSYQSETFNPPFPPTTQTAWDRTIIKYGQWEDVTDRGMGADGKNMIDTHVSIIIPKKAKTEGKKYLDWKEYSLLKADWDQYWTLNPSNTNRTIIVLGEGKEIDSSYTIAQLQKEFKSCVIRAFEEFDLLKHWEITAV